MAKNDKDFRGEDLRGRSFKNQDLTKADFSDCDLRGVDFSGANLTGAKFCNARMGKTLKAGFALLLFQLLLGAFASFIAIVGNFTMQWTSRQILAVLDTGGNANNDIIFITVYALLFTLVILFAINCKRLGYVVCFFGLAIAANGIVAAIVTGMENIAITAITTGLGVISISGAVSLTGITGIVTIIPAIIVAISMLPVGLESGISITYIIFGIYLGKRANKREEPQLLLLRNWSVKMACLRGTQFAFSVLNVVDFSNADLKYARFKNTKITNCCFKNAKNHHLALTENTPLEPRKIRDLVIDGITTDKNFSNLDLRGLDFSHLDLQGFDFSHADLSGANLSHCELTGAILEGWHIDTETCLDDIDCRYYYYSKNKEKNENKETNDEKYRMPPKSEYKKGEFTKIFQKVAENIDFIAHNEMELAAIKLSVEQVRVESGNDDIRVQAIEEKNGFIVVKVNVPKDEDRGVFYHEINVLKQEYETKIQYLEKKNYIQIGKIEVLNEQIKEQRNVLLNKIHAGDTIMGDKIIKTNNITDSTIHNSGILNLGEINGNLSQTIKQLPSANSELKSLLNQLQILINNSTLSEQDKKEALTETQAIAEAATKPKDEQESIVRKTLRYFKGLGTELQGIPETVESIIEIVEKIGVVFDKSG
jgi:uncharacterized protein YjbI with pentapeptide repeats